MPALRSLRSLAVAALTFAVCAAAAPVRAQQQPTSGVGVVVSASPIYLTPDPARTPLATLQPGTRVRVLTQEGDWYRVIFSDAYLGERTGYVLAATIRMERGAPPPPPPAVVPGRVSPAPGPVITQATPMMQRRNAGFASLNGTVQRDSTAFTATSSYPQYGETAVVTTNYGGVHPVTADLAIGQRVSSAGFYVILGATWAAQVTDASLAGSVPSPFALNSPRAVAGPVNEVHRQELGLHLDVGWGVTTDRIQVVAFAGPSFFRVKQGLVTSLNVAEGTPPGTLASFTTNVVESSKWRVGGNVGIDGSLRLWKALGVGVIVRYSEAKVPFSPADGTHVTIKAGGLQYGGGLRFRF